LLFGFAYYNWYCVSLFGLWLDLGAKKTVKDADYNYTDTVLKQGADLKVSGANRLASAAVDHKQNESNDETPAQTTEAEQDKK